MSGQGGEVLLIEPISREAFAAFGDVIAPDAVHEHYLINDGTARRFHALGRVDCNAGGGHAVISLVRAQPRPMPFLVSMLERHPLGSQAFVPLSPAPYLVVVSESPSTRPRAFLAAAGEGVNFHRGTWHHPLLALREANDFLVIDRDGAGDNCEVADLDQSYSLRPGAAG